MLSKIRKIPRIILSVVSSCVFMNSTAKYEVAVEAITGRIMFFQLTYLKYEAQTKRQKTIDRRPDSALASP